MPPLLHPHVAYATSQCKLPPPDTAFLMTPFFIRMSHMGHAIAKTTTAVAPTVTPPPHRADCQRQDSQVLDQSTVAPPVDTGAPGR